MKKKPIVCVIDESDEVRKGWKDSLGQDARLVDFRDHVELVAAAESDPTLVASLHCIIVGRYFKHLGGFDIVTSDALQGLKQSHCGPIFLNWQGYITKEELASSFDGKLFHRYGVKWQTLRLRIQKFEKIQKNRTRCLEPLVEMEVKKGQQEKPTSSRPERCFEILKLMAANASGSHREKIEYFAQHDRKSGIQLLEAIYNRLVTDKNARPGCPSRYINSSPVIAKRMLRDALYE